MLVLGNIYFIPMFGKLTETKPVYWRISTPLTTTTNGQSLQSTLQGPLKFSFKALQEKTEQRRQAKTTGIKKKINQFCLNVEGKREGKTQNKLSFLIMYLNFQYSFVTAGIGQLLKLWVICLCCKPEFYPGQEHHYLPTGCVKLHSYIHFQKAESVPLMQYLFCFTDLYWIAKCDRWILKVFK